jgi:AI-2 transport protein TqsA
LFLLLLNAEMKLQHVAMTMVIVFLTFYLLYLGQSLLLPLVIAGAVAYLINILTHAICKLQLGGLALPRPLALLVAIAVILASSSLLIELITVNIASVIKVAPEYQQNLERWIYKSYGLFGIEEAPNIQEILNEIDFRSYLQDFGGTVRSLISRTGIIILYLIFLLLEQRTFPAKLRGLITNPDRLEDVSVLIGKIRSDIRTYIGIKVLTSAATGLLSYLVLHLVGVDFASFWAVLIFFLNFVPTIGSIVATTFPSVLALVQFDTLGPFVVTASVLTGLQFTIGSLLEPRFMGNRLNLSPIVILLSLGLWGAIWGIPGMFLCVPITVVIVIIFSYFPETRPVAVLLSGTGELSVGPRRRALSGKQQVEQD